MVLQDKIVAQAMKLFRKKKLSRLLNSWFGIGKQGWPSSWKKEKDFIRKLMEKGPMKGKRKWKREDLYERKRSA